MSKCTEIREFCGDYAFDVEYSEDNKFTMFFNSRKNAETVKRCIEADDSIPNVATAVDFVEVVRCEDCIHYCLQTVDGGRYCEMLKFNSFTDNGFCSHGERKVTAESAISALQEAAKEFKGVPPDAFLGLQIGRTMDM